MRFLISLTALLFVSTVSAQTNTAAETTAVSSKIVQAPRLVRELPVRNRYYVPFFWSFFEERFNAQSGVNTSLSKAAFQSIGTGVEFERVRGRWGTGLSVIYLQGQVDLEGSSTVAFPRYAWNGVQGGARVIYRYKPRIDIAATASILRKDIESFGASYSPAYGISLRMGLSNTWQFYQTLGTYGAGNSLAINTGLRWFVY